MSVVMLVFIPVYRTQSKRTRLSYRGLSPVASDPLAPDSIRSMPVCAVAACFLITHGVATATKALAGVDIVVAELAKGKLIGEMSFASNFSATATVTATTELVALRISKTRLLTLFDGNTALGMGVFRSIASTLSRRLSQMTERFAFTA